MYNFRYIIIDEDSATVEEVQQLVLLRGTFELVGVAQDALSAIELINKEQPDLVLATTSLSGETIFDVLSDVSFTGFRIILMGLTQEHVIEAIRFKAIDYLTKPIDPNEILSAVGRFEKMAQREQTSTGNYRAINYNLEKLHKIRKISVPTTKGYLIKDIEHLTFIQAVSNYSEYCFDHTEKYIVAKTLTDSEIMLEPFGFLRIHQSYLVNLSCMEFFNVDEMIVHLHKGITLPVSTRRKSILIDRLKMVL
ncbi:MAG: LytTR family transcriptional regulator DNA-binding domain-containing protein [Chitinophagaceae bacterium]